MAVFFGVAFFIITAVSAAQDRRYAAEGVVVTGRVVDKTIEESRSDSGGPVTHSYRLVYEFRTPDGAPHRGTRLTRGGGL